jgi:hypothetical protein
MPNLVLFGLVAVVLYYKLHLLRLTIRETIRTEVEALKTTAPPVALGEQFVKEGFEEIRQDLRELTVRLEHVEHLLGDARG